MVPCKESNSDVYISLVAGQNPSISVDSWISQCSGLHSVTIGSTQPSSTSFGHLFLDATQGAINFATSSLVLAAGGLTLINEDSTDFSPILIDVSSSVVASSFAGTYIQPYLFTNRYAIGLLRAKNLTVVGQSGLDSALLLSSINVTVSQGMVLQQGAQVRLAGVMHVEVPFVDLKDDDCEVRFDGSIIMHTSALSGGHFYASINSRVQFDVPTTLSNTALIGDSASGFHLFLNYPITLSGHVELNYCYVTRLVGSGNFGTYPMMTLSPEGSDVLVQSVVHIDAGTTSNVAIYAGPETNITLLEGASLSIDRGVIMVDRSSLFLSSESVLRLQSGANLTLVNAATVAWLAANKTTETVAQVDVNGGAVIWFSRLIQGSDFIFEPFVSLLSDGTFAGLDAVNLVFSNGIMMIQRFQSIPLLNVPNANVQASRVALYGGAVDCTTLKADELTMGLGSSIAGTVSVQSSLFVVLDPTAQSQQPLTFLGDLSLDDGADMAWLTDPTVDGAVFVQGTLTVGIGCSISVTSAPSGGVDSVELVNMKNPLRGVFQGQFLPAGWILGFRKSESHPGYWSLVLTVNSSSVTPVQSTLTASPTTSPASTPPSPPLNLPLIIGVAVGGGIGVAVVVLIIIMIWRFKTIRDERRFVQLPTDTATKEIEPLLA